MRLLTVPNWSFGRDQALRAAFFQLLEKMRVEVHYLAGDLDHNRTVTAFSGPSKRVFQTLMGLCELALPRIDLNRHMGVHPRIGALDVCPFVLPDPSPPGYRALLPEVETFGRWFAERFEVPVFFYEKSEKGRHEADLPTLRKGGFGSLIDRPLSPDAGPSRAHPRCGVTVMGVREFLIAMNVNLRTPDPALAKRLARKIRDARAEGDPRFLGVRALGFPLASQDLSQVSLNFTLPDLAPVDPVVEWVSQEAVREGVLVAGTELIGVIRQKDLLGATRLCVDPAQVIHPKRAQES